MPPHAERPFRGFWTRDGTGRDDSTIACLTSTPEREHVLARTISSLLPQVDEIRVVLNGYTHTPSCLKHNKIVVIYPAENYRSNGIFLAAEKADGYIFMCTDGLVYDSQWAEHQITWLERYKRKIAVALHGVILKDPYSDYHSRRKVIHQFDPNPTPVWVHLGACAWHSSLVRITRDEYAHNPTGYPEWYGMSDLVIAEHLQSRGIPVLCIPRSGGLVTQPVHAHDRDIHERSHDKDRNIQSMVALQAERVRRIPWRIHRIEE